MDFYKLLDRLEEWWRYPQPTKLQKDLIGMHTDVLDLDFVARQIAAKESAQYMLDNMRNTHNFQTDYDLHDWVVTQIDPSLYDRGIVLEFGVATGRTLNHFGRILPNHTVHGFDSFEGLPEKWYSFNKGHFAQPTPKVRKNCQLWVGWFNETVPKYMERYADKPIALLHVDSDLYSSATYILNTLRNNIVPGTVIVFDEYFNHPTWKFDEFLAWQEFVEANNIKYEYIGYVGKHQKVALRVLQPLDNNM